MAAAANSLVAYIPDLRRYARSLTGDAWAADDLVQNTLERACERWQLWTAGSGVRAGATSSSAVSVQDLGYEEVARITGVPVGTVMSRLSRARSRLRELMDDRQAAAAPAAVALRRLK